MRPKILTYVPPSGRQRKRKGIAAIITGRTDTVHGIDKPIKQYRHRMLPYISPDLRWMCLWMALLLGVMLVMSAIDTGVL